MEEAVHLLEPLCLISSFVAAEFTSAEPEHDSSAAEKEADEEVKTADM